LLLLAMFLGGCCRETSRFFEMSEPLLLFALDLLTSFLARLDLAGLLLTSSCEGFFLAVAFSCSYFLITSLRFAISR